MSALVRNGSVSTAMAQKPGPTVPLRERLAVQAELLKRRATLPPRERTGTAIGKRIGRTQAAISKAMRGEMGEDVRDRLLRLWETDIAALLKRHRELISRVENGTQPEAQLRLMVEKKELVSDMTATADGAVAALEAGRALSEDTGIPLERANSIALELLAEVDPNPLEIYRAGRRRLGVH